MLISYNSKIIQEVCFHSGAAVKYLGEKAALSLQARHSDLQAASNIYDMPIGEIKIYDNVCMLTVQSTLSIEMSPNYGINNDDLLYDWSTVLRVKIMGINDVK